MIDRRLALRCLAVLAGVNHQRRDDVVLAPIRLGLGVRSGTSVGYMHYQAKRTWNPI